jgi:hypothetical protein
MHPNITFTIDNSINFLDLTITNNNGQFEDKTYRKPTTTDLIIHNETCHPFVHKMSAITYLPNRMNTCLTTEENKPEGKNQIQRILNNNKYHPQITSSSKKAQKKDVIIHKNDTWATFTYAGTKETRSKTKSFRTINTLKKY